MKNNSQKKSTIHWPILILGIVVAIILFSVLFLFQVNEVEYAIVERFGKAIKSPPAQDGGDVKVYPPGWHLKIPFVDRVWKHDNRKQQYELTRGQLEEMQTADDIQLIVSTFTVWRVGDVYKYYKRIETRMNAQSKLDEIIRNSRSNVIGRHPLADFINVNEDDLKLDQIEQEILADAKPIAEDEYGIEIMHIGIKHLGFPESVTQEVFNRMRAERETRAEKILSVAAKEASKIRTQADAKAEEILIDARGEATHIRGEGDEAAAGFYSGFSANPELAIFIRKLRALRDTLGDDQTTLILDTKTIPYDLLLPNAIDLTKMPQEVETSSGKKAREPAVDSK
ncbi:MAG: protease modulator HflC [Lentisphaeria bacterium]